MRPSYGKKFVWKGLPPKSAFHPLRPLSEIGAKIGEVGSTGPHLHYETRIDGEAVDPQKFLRAGVRLSAG